MKNVVPATLLALSLAALSACGSSSYYRGKDHFEHGRYDEAVNALEESQRQKPDNMSAKALLTRAKLAASQQHFREAQKLIATGDLTRAVEELQKALIFDPSNQHAQDTLQRLLDNLAKEEQQAKQARLSLDEMKKQAGRESGPKLLDPASNIPLVLKFTNTPVKTIYDAISKASGVNFIYDERADLQKKVTLDFANVRLQQVLDYLMMQTKHFYQVVDNHTLMIIPDNKQKRDEYEEQVMRTFYLSNAEAKDVFQLVRSILQARKMAMNQDLNSITIKDTPEMVALAGRIIESNDKSKGEVAVDVELIEVNSNKLKTLGVDLSAGGKTLTVMPRANAVNGNNTTPLPSGQWGAAFKGSMYIAPLPNFIVSFILSDSDSQILAKPQLRVMEGKKASVHIGDKQPIPTANLQYSTTGSTNYIPMTSYTYQDVGVKIEIEPKVHHNREITIKLKSEVSSVTGEVKQEGGLSQPIIGTREVTTEIRLEDGETSMLAGLIREEDGVGYSGIPGVGEVPFLRRLFGTTKTTKIKTDVILLLTPHIIRMPNITEDDLRGLWVGTEAQPKLQGFRESSFQPSPFEGEAGAEEAPKSPEKKPEEAKPEEKAPVEPEKSAPVETPKPATPDAPPAEAPAASQARLLLSPTTLQVAAGGSVVLNLVVVGAKDARTMSAEVDFPTDVLAFQGADEGTFFKMGGGVSSFSASEGRPGLLALDWGRADGTSSGSGLLLRLRFTGAKAGVARVNLGSAAVVDAEGRSVAMAPVAATITVQGGDGGAPKQP